MMFLSRSFGITAEGRFFSFLVSGRCPIVDSPNVIGAFGPFSILVMNPYVSWFPDQWFDFHGSIQAVVLGRFQRLLRAILVHPVRVRRAKVMEAADATLRVLGCTTATTGDRFFAHGYLHIVRTIGPAKIFSSIVFP